MRHLVITIGREFGCNAREIGRQLASGLGVRFYDKELVQLAAAKAGMNSNPARKTEKKPEVEDWFLTEFGYGSTYRFFSERAVSAQASVVREIAKAENCVMLGRCADFFLQDCDYILNVFVYAPLGYRIDHISKEYDVSPEEAKKLIASIDRRRHRYYKFVTGRNRGDRHGRNLMIDVDMFGIEGAVKLAREAASLRFAENDIE